MNNHINPQEKIDCNENPILKQYWVLLIPPFIICILLILPLFNGQYRTGSDIEASCLPMRAFYAESLANNEMILWDPHIYGGFPLLAEGEVGACHPFHIFLYKTFSLITAFHIELFSVYIFAFIGTFLFLKYLKWPIYNSLFGASFFTFSPFMLSHYAHVQMIAVFAHTPWILHTVFRLTQSGIMSTKQKVKILIQLSLLIASQVLLAYPPAVWLSAIVWVTALLIWSWRASTKMRSLRITAISITLATMLSAPQLFVTADFYIESLRHSVDNNFLNMWSVHPWNFLQFIAPYMLKSYTYYDPLINSNSRMEFSIYPGIGILILALWAMTSISRQPPAKATTIKVLSFGCLFAILLMLGRYIGLTTFFKYIPILRAFRAPTRYISIFLICINGLACFGIFELFSKRLSRKQIIIPLGLLILSLLIHLFAFFEIIIPNHATENMLLLSIGIIGSICIVAILSINGNKKWSIILLLLSLIDVGLYSFAAGPGNLQLKKISALTKIIEGRKHTNKTYRVLGYWSWQVMAGEYNAWGYTSLEPNMKMGFTKKKFFELLAVRKIKKRNGVIYNVKNPTPRIRLENPYNGNIKIITDAPQRLNISVYSTLPQRLIIADRWDKNWRCSINGNPIPIEKYYDITRAVNIPTGESNIIFTYLPIAYFYGKIISTIGLVIISLLSYLFIIRSEVEETTIKKKINYK